jgi:hypothetical protein
MLDLRRCFEQVLDVEVPAVHHRISSHSYWAEVVHGEGVYPALLPGLRNEIGEDETTERDTGTTKRTVVAGQHFQLTVPSAWRTRNLSGEHTDNDVRFAPGQISMLAQLRLAQRGNALAVLRYHLFSLSLIERLKHTRTIRSAKCFKSHWLEHVCCSQELSGPFSGSLPASSVWNVEATFGVCHTHLKRSHQPFGEN